MTTYNERKYLFGAYSSSRIGIQPHDTDYGSRKAGVMVDQKSKAYILIYKQELYKERTANESCLLKLQN